MFADMKCNDLNAFIMARQDAEKPEFTAKSKIPKKLTPTEASVGERNKILIAFDSISVLSFQNVKGHTLTMMVTKDILFVVER
jgi:hypothetical protein